MKLNLNTSATELHHAARQSGRERRSHFIQPYTIYSMDENPTVPTSGRKSLTYPKKRRSRGRDRIRKPLSPKRTKHSCLVKRPPPIYTPRRTCTSWLELGRRVAHSAQFIRYSFYCLEQTNEQIKVAQQQQ